MSIAIPPSLQPQLNQDAAVLFTDMLSMKPSQRILTPEQRADSTYDHRPCTELVELDTEFDQRMNANLLALERAMQADREYRIGIRPQIESEYTQASYKYSVPMSIALTILETLAASSLSGVGGSIGAITSLNSAVAIDAIARLNPVTAIGVAVAPVLILLGTWFTSIYVGKKIAIHKAGAFLEEQHPHVIQVIADIWARECEAMPKTYGQLHEWYGENVAKTVLPDQQSDQNIRVQQLRQCKPIFKALSKRAHKLQEKGQSIFNQTETVTKK